MTLTGHLREQLRTRLFQSKESYSLHHFPPNLFPEIMRTKRAVKLIFKNNSFQDNKKWKRDELRIFMTTAKKSISSSNKPYYVKIFDLYSRKMVNIYKFSSKDYGWKTINISGIHFRIICMHVIDEYLPVGSDFAFDHNIVGLRWFSG
jgi:ABC-type long-subunit fatty acid transport system fused permease/ATPase subunit